MAVLRGGLKTLQKEQLPSVTHARRSAVAGPRAILGGRVLFSAGACYSRPRTEEGLEVLVP